MKPASVNMCPSSDFFPFQKWAIDTLFRKGWFHILSLTYMSVQTKDKDIAVKIFRRRQQGWDCIGTGLLERTRASQSFIVVLLAEDVFQAHASACLIV